MGDILVVVVARDSTAEKRGKAPIFNEDMRLKLVSELKPVDEAVLGHHGDIFRTVAEVKPDIITLGHDQNFDPEYIKQRCDEMGLEVKVQRISKYTSEQFESSSEVRKKLLEIIEGSL